jgi:hypothetical protein
MIKRSGKYVGLVISCVIALIADTFMFALQDSETAEYTVISVGVCHPSAGRGTIR